MPVFREDRKSGLSYMVNAIYEQKSLGKLSDPTNKFLKKVVRFLIANNVKELMLENNTSNTIGTLLEQKFKESNELLHIEYFEEKELVVNITEHELVPKHILLTDEEKKILLKK